MRVALLSLNARAGDAVGEALAEKAGYFLDRHADLRVYVEEVTGLHPFLHPYTHTLDARQPKAAQRRWLQSADLVLIEYSQHAKYLELLPWLLRQRGRVVLDYHGVTPPALGPSASRAALVRGQAWRAVAGGCDVVIAHSEFACQELCEASGLEPERVSVVGFPIDAPATVDASRVRSFRFQHAPADAKVALFVGRLAPNKRLPWLMPALLQLQDGPAPVHLWVVGAATGCYAEEWQKARGAALDAGIGDRLHLLGRLSDSDLQTAYAAADVLIVPSVHEGFCRPVREAMAHGLPVVAARAAALPETAASAGLLFAVDSQTDCAEQLRRVLFPREPQAVESRRVAVVASRADALATRGAERSLMAMARMLAERGWTVDVHALGDRPSVRPEEWGTVHTYPADAADGERLAEALRQVERGESDAGAAVVRHLPASKALLDGLRSRGPYRAILAGPYLSGLTLAVAREFADRAVIAPCFHDEPVARLPQFRESLRGVSALLFHSTHEQQIAERTLGIAVPGSTVVGTYLPEVVAGDAARGQSLAKAKRPYLLCLGRQIAEKGVGRLIDWIARTQPAKFDLVLAGESGLPLPAEPWCWSLGLVCEADKRDLIAGASACVSLSERESLGLAVLEAWQQATPAIVTSGTVLASHVERNGGGWVVDDFSTFAAALDELPGDGPRRGRQGRADVAEQYGHASRFAMSLEAAIAQCNCALPRRMATAGRALAANDSRSRWRTRFEAVIERALHAEPRTGFAVDVWPTVERVEAGVWQSEAVLPVEIALRGRGVAVPDGIARTELIAQVEDANGQDLGAASITALAGVLGPFAVLPASVRVPLGFEVGSLTVRLWARTLRPNEPAEESLPVRVTLDIVGGERPAPERLRRASSAVERSLREADAIRALPAEFAEPAGPGRLGSVKTWIKTKLLGSFARGRVDALAVQQSAVNAALTRAGRELANEQHRHAALAEEVAALRDELRQMRGDMERRDAGKPVLRLVSEAGGKP